MLDMTPLETSAVEKRSAQWMTQVLATTTKEEVAFIMQGLYAWIEKKKNFILAGHALPIAMHCNQLGFHDQLIRYRQPSAGQVSR